MRVRSVPADASMEVSVLLNLRVLIVSVPHESVAVGCDRASDQISMAEEAVANMESFWWWSIELKPWEPRYVCKGYPLSTNKAERDYRFLRRFPQLDSLVG